MRRNRAERQQHFSTSESRRLGYFLAAAFSL
jgi:hypothetical protein